MPAGGTWSVQNKKRPGAYINFTAISAPNTTLGSQGTILTFLPMDWGPVNELIEITGDDLLSGKSRTLIGYTSRDAESFPYRLALTNCHKMLVYRANIDGERAQVVQGDVTFTAKYPGTKGNDLTIVVINDRPSVGKSSVQVLLNGAVRETFVIEDEADYANLQSDWIDFSVAGITDDFSAAQMGNARVGETKIGIASTTVPSITALAVTPTAGLPLVGGTNGTVDYDTLLPQFREAAKLADWSILAVPTLDTAVVSNCVEFVEELREVDGKMVSAAVAYLQATAPAVDSEAIIATFQGFNTTNGEVCTAALMPLYVAGLFAGTTLGESNTCREVVDAQSIINPLPDGDVEAALDNGWFLITYRTDGVIVVELDINTLRTYTSDRPVDYHKNLVIRLLNYVAQQSTLIFVRDFAGKVRNNELGRSLFKARMITFFENLQDAEAIQNFDSSTDIEVYAGEQPEGVVLEVAIQYVDAMEKLYMTLNIVA